MTGKDGMKKGIRSTLCSKCKVNERTPSGKYCRLCRNAYMRNWRKLNPLSAEQKAKDIVRSKTNIRIQRGLLIPYPCEICGLKKVEAHHDDYRKPYCVRWLCRKHHVNYHKEIRKKNINL